VNIADTLATFIVCFGVYLLVTKLSGPSPYKSIQEVHKYAESKGWVLVWRGVLDSTYKKGCTEISLIPHAGLDHNRAIIDQAEEQCCRESKLAQDYMEILNG